MSALPPVRVSHPHVEIDELGTPMVRGGRVPVRRLYAWFRQGTTVETLLRRYPQLGAARIFDALAFAHDNLDLITADLERERELLAREPGEGAPKNPKERVADARAKQTKLPF